MIATLAEIKLLLQISDTTYDTLLALEIECVQNFIMNYCKNSFLNGFVKSYDTLVFTGNSITSSENLFLTDKFLTGSYKITGSDFNDGWVTVSNVQAGTLTVSETLRSETCTNEVSLYLVDFPKELKMVMAKMVGFGIWNKLGIQSESFSRYSVNYGSGQNIAGYPDIYINPLNKFRRLFKDVY